MSSRSASGQLLTSAVPPARHDVSPLRSPRLVRVLGKQAVINCATDEILSIVSDQYRLLTHSEALAYGRKVCEEAFPHVAEDEWNLNLLLSANEGRWEVDLEHRSGGLNFDGLPGERVPDTYGPFVRVSNSYDRSRAFAIVIGFKRKVCSNGMVLPKAAVRIHYAHMGADLQKTIDARISSDDFQCLRDDFVAILQPVKNCVVPRKFFLPIVCGALDLQRPTKPERSVNAWYDLRDSLGDLSDKYADELGETGYAVLNTITEFASRPFGAASQRRSSLQEMAGTWLAAFSEQCSEREFRIDAYVDDLSLNPATKVGLGMVQEVQPRPGRLVPPCPSGFVA